MDILTLARQLGEAIQNDETYIDYKIKEQNAECDKELMELQERFTAEKSLINEEISKEKTNQKKLDELNSSVGELYSQIIDNPIMKAYNDSKQKFQEMLQKVSFIINSAALGQDPYLADPESENSCAGSCEGCSGCH